MNKIISFSLWGTNKLYLCGALENVKLAKKLFPGWTCRFYTSKGVSPTITAGLRFLGAEVVYKNPTIGYLALFWRFEPAYDDDVDIFIVRDSDSRLTPRDAEMVKDWEQSDKMTHIIRDNDGHNVHMLGATWGMKKGACPDFEELYIDFMKEYRIGGESNNYCSNRGIYFGTDQDFLNQKIYPLIKNRLLVHIADYECLKLGDNEKLAPPLDRIPDMSKAKEYYVGQVCNVEPEYENYIF